MWAAGAARSWRRASGPAWPAASRIGRLVRQAGMPPVTKPSPSSAAHHTSYDSSAAARRCHDVRPDPRDPRGRSLPLARQPHVCTHRFGKHSGGGGGCLARHVPLFLPCRLPGSQVTRPLAVTPFFDHVPDRSSHPTPFPSLTHRMLLVRLALAPGRSSKVTSAAPAPPPPFSGGKIWLHAKCSVIWHSARPGAAGAAYPDNLL